MDSGGQYGISFKGAFKNNVGNARALGKFSRENGNKDPLEASNMPNLMSDPTYQVESDPSTFRVA